MTMCDRFSTWREAYEYAYAEIRSEPYRGWGWAIVVKNDGHDCDECDFLCDHDGAWWAEIA